MTDLELTRLCAEAMGYDAQVVPAWEKGNEAVRVRGDEYSGSADDGWFGYDPLHDDAQAMALVKKFYLTCVFDERYPIRTWECRNVEDNMGEKNADLSRAIVTCVARLQSAKRGKPK